MRNKITRLMMYNIIGFLKNVSKKNFKNFSQISQKKFFWEISKNFELDMLYAVFRGVENDGIS